MTLEQEYQLSFYRDIAQIAQNIWLVQHVETQQFYVRKKMAYYHADVLKQLQAHPVSGTPQIHFLTEDEGTMIVIEDYIHGETLQHVLQQKGCFSEQEAVKLVCQLCETLLPLHTLNPPIIHRDIKPSNLILTNDDILYLIDFDAAKSSASGTASRDTDLIGTHGYAAPEQYGFAQSSPATDVYAIGVLLQVLLTGGKTELNSVSKQLQKVIKKCTALDPSDRYSNAGKLAAALHRATNPKPHLTDYFTGSWLPPGFRTKKLYKMILAGMYYLTITLTCADMAVDDPFPVWLYRFSVWLMYMLPISIVCNYRNVQKFLPYQDNPKRKRAVIICAAVIAFIAPITIITVIYT